MGTSGDKIVLLDGMGSGSGSATNGLLSMIPGMFANLIGGNKMDPNLVAALTNNREQATSRFNILSAKIDAQTTLINDKFCQLEMREMQNTINQLRPTPVPAYPSCSPYQTYGWGQAFYGGNYGCGCNNGCCNNGNAAI